MLERRRIKLIWGASKVIRGHWHFGLFGYYERVEGEPDSGMAISLRGVLALAATFGAVCYFAGALVLATVWQSNPYSLLTFEDALLYPLRRGVVAQKKGQAYIAEGIQLLKIGQGQDGARLLAQGVALYPQDSQARIVLARLYAAGHRRETALGLLQTGLTDEIPTRAYLESLFEIAEQAENFALIASTADRYLPRLQGDSRALDRGWLRSKKFAALLAERRGADALALAQEEGAGEPAAEQQVLALLELGRATEAVDFLAGRQKQLGVDSPWILRLRVRALREAGRSEDMARTLDAMRAHTVGDPRTAVYGVVQWAMAGRDDRAREAFDDYVFRFGGSAENIALVATPLAEIAHRGLLERCVIVAAERGYPVQSLKILLIEAAIQQGAWAAAAAELARLPAPTNPNPAASERVWRAWVQAVLDAVLLPGDAVQLGLLRHMRERPWSPKTFRRTIEALRRAGRRETAMEVLTTALGAYPASVGFKKQREELVRESPPATAAPASILPAVSAGGGARVLSEQSFFDELDRLIREKIWEQAEQLIRSQRISRPAPLWLESRDADLRLAEVRIRQGTGDTGAMRAAAGIYLNGDIVRARRLTAAALEIGASGDRDAALALLRAVVRKNPDFAPAKSALAKWEPPARAEKKS